MKRMHCVRTGLHSVLIFLTEPGREMRPGSAFSHHDPISAFQQSAAVWYKGFCTPANKNNQFMGRKSQIVDSFFDPGMPLCQGEFGECDTFLLSGKRGGTEHSGISGAQDRFPSRGERILSTQDHHTEQAGRQRQLS